MEKIKILIWGFGAMGRGMAEMLLTKTGIEIVGICDINPFLAGKGIHEVLDYQGDHPDVFIHANIDDLLAETKADLALLCTDSFTKGAFPKIKKMVENGINCISTAEEMSYPYVNEPTLAKEMDALAKKHGVSILGTGINPGFIMDLLVVALTGVMTHVDSIEAKRINSLSPFGPVVMHEQGVGITLEEYNKRLADKDLAGHVGFKESIYMIANALGLELDYFQQQMEPIITNIDRKSPYGEAKKGNLAGIDMRGQGFKDDKVLINMIHPQQIEPEMVGINTGDYINLTGNPNISMAITPEINGGSGTIAMCVNMIPHVINAKPGLKTMIDLPVPRAIMGDMRNFID
ncbi:MAG: 2,4-diaminopentanoate dehydrogenase [Acholeplasmataceae bacterium]